MQFLVFAFNEGSSKNIFARIPCVTDICLDFACVNGCTAFNQLIQVLNVVLATFLLARLVSLKENTCQTNVIIFISKALLILEIIMSSSNTLSMKHEFTFY